MLSRLLAKSFQVTVAQHAFFDDWERTKPREFWKRTVDLRLGIDLQLDKWWDKQKGGKAAVNLWCGHRWSVPPIPPAWLDEDGFSSDNIRLTSEIERETDHWWPIASESDLSEFQLGFSAMLDGGGIPWLRKVSSKEGFVQWIAGSWRQHVPFPYALELYGRDELRKRVKAWLVTAPTRIEQDLQWLVEIGMISPDVSQRLWLASIQPEDVCKARMVGLIEEIGD